MDKYEKIRIVGRGAYGTVFLCRHISDKKLVIIKQIPVEQMTKEERQAALNEVKVLSMLNHPNIIEYYENFLEDKALMIVMEYAQGGTLFEYLQQRNGQLLEEEEILRFLAQMLLSLQHVHSKQILHRDLKTQNILLDKKKEVIKIGDFGISKVLSSKSKAVTVVGTPCYISPELCEGKPYNQKSDIWALGCVLYELVSLKRAFEAQNLPALVLKIMKGTFEPVSERYSEELRELILKMLHLDPSKRPSISQIMAQPIVLNTLLGLFTDFGRVPCTRTPKALPNMPGSGRSRRSQTSTTKSTTEASGNQTLRKLSGVTSLYCWGGGVNTPCQLPLPSTDTHITQVSAGRTQKAAVVKSGRLLVWEAPNVGAESTLPGFTGCTSPAFVPRFLEGQSAVTIQHVACGDLFTACLTDRGILMTFGSGATGCLGHGNHQDVSQAKIVEKLLGFEVISVSCGASHVMAVTNEQEVFAWGRGDNGRLGLGNQEAHTSPQEVQIPHRFQPREVICSVDGSMVLTSTGQMLCCGSNRYNKLYLDDLKSGKEIEEVSWLTPVTAQPLCDLVITAAALGTSHSAVITDTGDCYTFGANQFGQLGYPHKYDETHQAHRVEELAQCNVTAVSCGDTFTVAVTEDGKVFSWGKAARGRLGRPLEETQLPRPVVFKDEEPFTVISLSSRHGTTLLATKPKPREAAVGD